MNFNAKYSHFTVNEIKPQGWLKRQLEIQAAGLSGNLDKMWPDVKDSAWIGGNRDSWERVPYWLDGFVPLAFLLDDEDLKARAKKYIDAIIDRQEKDGWICPCSREERSHYDVWPTFLISKVLVTYYECCGDERAFEAAYKTLKNLKYHIYGSTLFNWAQFRWFEALLPLYAIYKHRPEKWMCDLAVSLGAQGFNYCRLFENWRDQEPVYEWKLQTHIVNLMMALKSEAVFSAVSGSNPNEFARKMFDILQKYHGSPLGYINGDECLAGKSAISGTELCAVVEAMFSFEVLFEITGDTYWLDKLEEYAFNFLPTTVSEDMWTRQYVQIVNQIACRKRNGPSLYTTNSIEANIFGLEPNFGCCTANLHQGWPKFALSAFYQSEEGVVIASPVPASLEFIKNGSKIKIETATNYPFGDNARFKVTADNPTEFTVEIRIPDCKSAKIDGKEVAALSTVKINRIWDNNEITLSLNQKAEIIPCGDGLYCVKRGAIYFAAPIAENRKIIEYVKDGIERKFPYCDYDITPAEAWGFAFTEDKLTFNMGEIGEYPFSRTSPPMTIEARLALIDWGTEENQPNVCAALPQSTTPISYITKKLVPYGATTLRMTAMPKI